MVLKNILLTQYLRNDRLHAMYEWCAMYEWILIYVFVHMSKMYKVYVVMFLHVLKSLHRKLINNVTEQSSMPMSAL